MSRLSADEMHMLKVVDEHLEQRPPARPSPEVLDRVVAYAAERSRPDHARALRPARPAAARAKSRRPGGLAGRLSAAVVAACVLAGLGWWHMASTPPGEGPGAQQATLTSASPAAATVAIGEAADEVAPDAWNRADDVYEVYRRMQWVEARSAARAWQAPPGQGFRLASDKPARRR